MGVLTEVSRLEIRLLIIEVSIVLHCTWGDDLHHAAGPIYFSSQKFDSTLLLNRKMMLEQSVHIFMSPLLFMFSVAHVASYSRFPKLAST
jgi:hypothetical protein